MDSRQVREYTHYAISIFILTGAFLIPSCPFLRVYLLFLVVLLLHWITNGNKCCISQFDYKKDDIGYTQGILKRFGIEFSKTAVTVLNYSTVLFLIWYTHDKLQRTCRFNLNSLF
jgi:hypothetical protein